MMFVTLLIYLKGIFLMPLIIKTVGVTTYGGYVLLLSIWGFIYGISSFGVGIRAKRYLPSAENREKRREIYYPQFLFTFATTVGFTLFLIIFDSQIKKYLLKNEIDYSLVIIPLYFVTYFLYSQCSDYFRYTSRIKAMSFIGVCYTYFHVVFVLCYYFVFHTITIDSLVLLNVLTATLIFVPCTWVIFKEIGFKNIFLTRKELASEIKFGFPLVLNYIVDFVLNGIDRYCIALYMGVTAVGYYNPGYALGTIVIFIPKAMGSVMPQLLSKAVDNKDVAAANKMLNFSIKYYLLLAIPFVFGSTALNRPLLSLLANREVADAAQFVTPFVALGTLFYGLNIILSDALFVHLRTGMMLRMNLLAGAFNAISNLILLYFFRTIIIAGITTFLSYLIVFICIKSTVKEDWNIDFQLKVIVKSVIASLLMAVFLYYTDSIFSEPYSWGSVSIQLLSSIAVYFGAVLLFKTFSKSEIQFAKKIFSTR